MRQVYGTQRPSWLAATIALCWLLFTFLGALAKVDDRMSIVPSAFPTSQVAEEPAPCQAIR
jgi:hypothetical protein